MERYLFVENNDVYDDFVSQFGGGGQRYWESGTDTYLDIYSPETVLEQLNQAYNNRFYEEDDHTPLFHIFGQQMWHSNAYLIANRTALKELRKAIDVALKHKEIRLGLSPSDGDGYDLFIKCELCHWGDDGQDDPNTDEVWGCPNGDYSLTEARKNFKEHLIMYRDIKNIESLLKK